MCDKVRTLDQLHRCHGNYEVENIITEGIKSIVDLMAEVKAIGKT